MNIQHPTEDRPLTEAEIGALMLYKVRRDKNPATGKKVLPKMANRVKLKAGHISVQQRADNFMSRYKGETFQVSTLQNQGHIKGDIASRVISLLISEGRIEHIEGTKSPRRYRRTDGGHG